MKKQSIVAILVGIVVIFAGLLIVSSGEKVQASELPTPVIANQTFYGGSGDQRGTSISINGSNLYISGRDGINALLIGIPPSVPSWSQTLSGDTYFNSVAVSSSTVYSVGLALPPAYGASDGVGGTEHKVLLARHTTEGTFLGAQSTNYFPYRGGEGYSAVIVVDEGLAVAVYVAGGGEETGWGGARTILAKYTADGTLLWKRKYATDTNGNQIAGTGTRINSSTNGLAFLNGFLYLAGHDRAADQMGGSAAQGMLFKYDAVAQPTDPNLGAEGTAILNPVWARVTGFQGVFHGVTAFGGSLYVVGYTFIRGVAGSENYLIQKYNEAGTLQWSQICGGANSDALTGVVGIGSRLFAVGWTMSSGAGGKDAVILEIDPATGNMLSTTLFGGAQDDMANSVATDGTDLYVAGESKSFAEGGNTVGSNDVMLLRYTLAPSIAATSVKFTPQAVKKNDRNGDPWVMVKGSLPAPYAVKNIDPSTVKLNGTVPAVTDPKYGFTQPLADGSVEFMFKFDRLAVEATLSIGDTVVVTITGKVSYNNGTDTGLADFQGQDIIKVLENKKAAPTLAQEFVFAALPAYPQPSNPETWIPFKLAQGSEVVVTIYDTGGRLIRSLALGYHSPGIYTSQSKAAYWDGRNEAGEDVSSGVYFYTIQAGDFTATRKLIIVR